MRSIALILGLVLCPACEKGENAGMEEARKQAEAEQKAKEAAGAPAKVIRPPVPGQAKIPCTQLIDLAAYQTAINEKEPLTIKDRTKGEPDSAASCALHRGGKRPNEAEQQAIIKKEGRLGVLPGDELCHVTAECYTIETLDRFKRRCAEKKDRDDESMGTYACVQIVAQGVDDVPVFRFFDEDTKCIIRVGGGPSNVNSDMIRSCAKVARDTIGPAQIAVTAPPVTPPAPAGSGSGS